MPAMAILLHDDYTGPYNCDSHMIMNNKSTQSRFCRLFCILLIYICLTYYTNDSMGASLVYRTIGIPYLDLSKSYDELDQSSSSRALMCHLVCTSTLPLKPRTD